MDPVRLAIDVGPLYGRRTGVGVAVAELVAALDDHAGVELLPYLLSFRTTPEPPARRLPLPAAAAVRAWSRLDHPRVDRWLGDAEVVHGTNYVVPPSRRPALVSVYDCWFLANPARGIAGRPPGRRGVAAACAARRHGARVEPRHGRRRPRPARCPRRRGRPPRSTPRRRAAGARHPPRGSPTSTAGPTCSPSARSSGARTCPALVAAFAACRTRRRRPRDRRRARRRQRRARRRRRAAACRHPRARDPSRPDRRRRQGLAATPRRLPRLSLPRRGVRLPDPRSPERSACPSWRHAPARSPRSPATAPSSSPSATRMPSPPRCARVLDDDVRRAELVAAGHCNVTRFSWSATAEHSSPSTAGSGSRR